MYIIYIINDKDISIHICITESSSWIQFSGFLIPHSSVWIRGSRFQPSVTVVVIDAVGRPTNFFCKDLFEDLRKDLRKVLSAKTVAKTFDRICIYYAGV